MFLEAKIAGELIASALGDGPDGFNVKRNVAAPVDLNSPTPAVKTEIDIPSAAAAKEKHNSGFNKPFSEAMGRAEQRVVDGLDKYDSFKLRSGVRSAQRYSLRSAHLDITPDKASSGPRPPSMMHSRKEHTVRSTLSAAAKHFASRQKELASLPGEKTTALNAETLPMDVKKKIAEEALRTGQKNTALGPIPQGKKKERQWAGLITAPGWIMD